MDFRGRKKEATMLEAAWRAPASAFIPVYGRRRVGKSELIVHFMGDKGGIYFVGKRAPSETQITEFLETASRALNEPLLAQARVNGWREALELVVKRWTGSQKLILTLDEFQWMAEASPELPSVIQELWDRQWSKSGRVMLILCGSYLGFMEREVLGKKSPLFGRRTAQILLRPFDHLEAAEFHPRYSVTDQAKVYGICGGIPMYLLAFDERQSVEQNIITRILDDMAVLAREPEFLLREELRDLMPYHAVLMALAQGKTAPVQLASATGIDVRGLNYHLHNLMELGYVQRRYPLTGGKPSVRSVRYALDDPFLRFWFRFIFPHQSVLRMLGPKQGYAEIFKPEIEAYYGRCFERLCREALPFIYRAEGVRAAFQCGEYWDKAVQVDIVGVREDGWTDLGECKWGDVSSVAGLTAELESKISHYPNQRNATIGRRLFVRALKARSKTPEARVHTLTDLYKLPGVA
ncbi:MAG: ATP-binding protein [Prosthecobacter sp.]|nr:ATP-binding protein [Prosthecobacter sp.]